MYPIWYVSKLKSFFFYACLISGPVLREVTVHIDGMHCQNCRVRIENHLNEMDGIVAKVNLNKKAAAISVYKDVDDLEIQNTIEKLGYTVVSME